VKKREEIKQESRRWVSKDMSL